MKKQMADLTEDQWSKQFKLTTDLVWAILTPWLKLHFGDKCEDYQLGCITCERWKLAEQLLDPDTGSTSIESQIHELKERIKHMEDFLSSNNPKDGKC